MAVPSLIKPMLAKGGGEPFDDDRYGFEVKWDGVLGLDDDVVALLELIALDQVIVADRA